MLVTILTNTLSIVVPYELYELYDWGKKFWNFTKLYKYNVSLRGTLWNLRNFTFGDTFRNFTELYNGSHGTELL